jgi:hypothetical protein
MFLRYIYIHIFVYKYICFYDTYICIYIGREKEARDAARASLGQPAWTVCIFIYMYIYLYLCVCIRIYIYVYIHIYMYTYIYLCIYTFLCVND